MAGPGEGTAIGNILIQMINQKVFDNLAKARQFLATQIEVKTYTPQTTYPNDLISRYIAKVK